MIIREKQLRPVLTVKELAEVLRVHHTTIYRMLREGKVPGFKLGSDWRFNREQIEEWVEE